MNYNSDPDVLLIPIHAIKADFAISLPSSSMKHRRRTLQLTVLAISTISMVFAYYVLVCEPLSGSTQLWNKELRKKNRNSHRSIHI
jgi:hypothetical protein